MKPTLLTLSLIFIVSMGMAQSKQNTIQWLESTETIMAVDTTGEIFSFKMTGNTNRLKPVDTVFYRMENIRYRKVYYKFFADMESTLIVTCYYENKQWLFFRVQLTPYKKEQ